MALASTGIHMHACEYAYTLALRHARPQARCLVLPGRANMHVHVHAHADTAHEHMHMHMHMHRMYTRMHVQPCAGAAQALALA